MKIQSLSRLTSTALSRRVAFCRLELLLVLVVLLLLAAVMVPAVANVNSNSARAVCFNNLRLIGRGIQTWSANHGHSLPWQISVADGGLRLDTGVRFGAVWIDFIVFSNEFVTPAILACPEDTGVRRIRTVQEFQQNPANQNNSVSYPLHLDGSTDRPRSWLSGDRNLPAQPGDGCSARVLNLSGILVGDPLLRWTNAVHGDGLGHVLTTDGSVELTDSARLRDILFQQGIDDNGMLHFLRPR